ncbi:MAG TPA: arsinothricin resistance N-acetyltransferase ArsN1 family A [Candidatus Udaeobacter sp.]|nr:arsinothricin resistance N-acetyltransferase ArsN1 family A [Candidatus Udaeobacter sp.]
MKQQCQRNQRNSPEELAETDGIRVRNASLNDAAPIAEIYNQGIDDRVATYETQPRSVEEQEVLLRVIADRYPVVVAEIDGEIVGWAGAVPYRARECYRGIGEFSMYVRRDWRGRGVGDLLLAGLFREAERLRLWKLLSRIFPFNEASRALCRKHGFREVGVYEKHARLDGRWLDVVIVEKLIASNFENSTR